MRRRTLTELANNPDLISGIYNYCDRWCERCPLTSRCLVFATEAEDGQPSNHDAANAAFWKRLDTVFQETLALVPQWATTAAVDLTSLEERGSRRRKRNQVDNHPLVLAGKQYARAAADWFRQFDDGVEQKERNAPREVIQWYQYQISVKTIRALAGQTEESNDYTETSESQKDSDGSAKVALIGIDRSIAAWRLIQLATQEYQSSIVPLILQLAHLRHRIESQFPEARQYIRPGFDDLPAVNT